MRKTIALILLFALVCGLVGCGNSKDPTKENSGSDSPNPGYNVAELLGYQAHMLSQQLGLAVCSDYAENSNLSAEALSSVKHFTVPATAQPEVIKLLGKTTDDFMVEIKQVLNKSGNAQLMSLSKELEFEQHFYSPAELNYNMTVYLRYSKQCHILVHFVPVGNNIVSAQVLPLPWNSAHLIVSKYFPSAKSYEVDGMKAMFSKVEQVDITATETGTKVSADYYARLARSAFENTKALNNKDIADFTSDTKLAANLTAYSKAISNGFVSAKVYDVTELVDTLADELVGADTAEGVEHWSQMKAATNLPDSYTNLFGDLVVTTNAILADLLETDAMGAVANEGEKTVLVLLQVTNELTLLVCIYPNENNVYEYGFACIPASMNKAQDMVANTGAIAMD